MSNAKINATPRWLCQLPVAATTTTLYGHNVPRHIHIYILIWPVRSPSSSLLLFYLNTSSFRFVPWHLAAILCQFPVSVIRTGEPENGETKSSATRQPRIQSLRWPGEWYRDTPCSSLAWLSAKCSAINLPS